MGLRDLKRSISESCTSCGNCVKECLFLQKHGTPKEIADSPEFKAEAAFECSLCRLCEAVCPVSLGSAAMLLEFRREALRSEPDILKRYKHLLTYESLGSSKLLTRYNIPDGCDTVLFPGCEFSHTRFDLLKKLYKMLKSEDKNLGIVLDCCFKPSHDLGRADFFDQKIKKLEGNLSRRGIKKIITLCPSCLVTLREHLPGIKVSMVYERLSGIKAKHDISSDAHIIDPCTVRFDKDIITEVRELLSKSGVPVKELKHSGEKTLCCGEGGATNHVTPKYKDSWLKKRREEVSGTVITYCAGCNNILRDLGDVRHLLDILLENKTPHRKHNVFGYLKRALLKYFL